MIADGEYVPDLKNISDGQLFALIAAKDDLAHAAYRVLYDRYAQLIWSLCCDAGSKLVRWNKEQFVEELFSQTMIKIYVHPTILSEERFRPGSPASPETRHSTC